MYRDHTELLPLGEFLHCSTVYGHDMSWPFNHPATTDEQLVTTDNHPAPTEQETAPTNHPKA